MKKGIQRFLSVTVVFMLLTLCIPAAHAGIAPTRTTEFYDIYQLGQVTLYVNGAFAGSDNFDLSLDLNGYMPQTLTWTVKGDFTEEEARVTYERFEAGLMRDAYSTGASTMGNYYSGVHYWNPLNAGIDFRMYDVTYADHDTVINTVRCYTENVYQSDRTPTSVTYTFIPPGTVPIKSMQISNPYHVVIHIYNPTTGKYEPRATRNELFIDGQLVMEVTVSGDGRTTINESAFRNYTFYPANFQTVQDSPQITASPTTSRVYLDGKQVDLGAYLIGGNNYVKLRDVAALLDTTAAQFNTAWDAEKNQIELLRGEAYSPQGGELQTLPAGVASATLSTAQIMYEREWSSRSHPDSFSSNFAYEFEYSNLQTVEDSYGYVRYIATVPEYFLPNAYNIGGNNYYKLRDIAHIAGFTVGWDATTNSVLITTEPGG